MSNQRISDYPPVTSSVVTLDYVLLDVWVPALQVFTTKRITPANLVGSISGPSGVTPSSIGALAVANNLSDLANAATARTNLGLSTAATATFGTTAGTVAQGNDSRIVGALQSTNNLSDVGSATTARTNISAAKSGANGDITSLSALSMPLSVGQGGTGTATSTGTGSVVLSASPTLTGTVTVPTASPGTNSTAAASTAFVAQAIAASSFTYVAGIVF